MMFNGIKTWPGNKVIETFESMGLRFGRDVNAYTSYDETVYSGEFADYAESKICNK